MENIKERWLAIRNNQIISALLEGKELQEVVNSLSKTNTSRSLHIIGCCDGRFAFPGKIGIAGSGILLPAKEKEEFVDCFRKKVNLVTAHKGCAAAKNFFATLKPEQIPDGIKDSDDYGSYFAQKLAREFGADFLFLDKDCSSGELHDEVMLVLDLTGKFDATGLGFPPHFLCSGPGFGIGDTYIAEEIKMLSGIALGSHGFGEFFNQKNPFYIVVIASDSLRAKHWIAIAEQVKKSNDRISVKEFIW